MSSALVPTVKKHLMAAMGGERERAELAAFDKLLADTIAAALLAELEKEAAENGVDVRT